MKFDRKVYKQAKFGEGLQPGTVEWEQRKRQERADDREYRAMLKNAGACVMTLREFLQQRWITERPAFQRVLHALPLAQFAYSPHERSPSTAQIVWTLALEAKVCSELIDILEKAPVMFTAAQLRVSLRALVNIDPYSFADDVAEHYDTANDENNQQPTEEILLSP